MLIREIKPGDSHRLVDMDHKLSEFPYTIEEWKLIRNFFQEWFVDIIEDGEIIGFAVSEFDEKAGFIIHKLVGNKEAGLKRIEERAKEALVTVLEYSAPECSCRGKDDPYDISDWLVRNGFRCEEVLKENYEAYGQKFDVYVFRKRGI